MSKVSDESIAFYRDAALLYDAAFSWDVDEEVLWLLEHMPDAKKLLEPACGAGRHMLALARRGLQVVGVDRSPQMIRRAAMRFRGAGLPLPEIYRQDIRGMRLIDRFDGAYCPINSLGYLLEDEALAAHFEAVARVLRPGAAYLIQLDLKPNASAREPSFSLWESKAFGLHVRCVWRGIGFLPGTMIEEYEAKIEILNGARAGEVLRSTHLIRTWSWPALSRLLSASSLTHEGAFDGSSILRRPVSISELDDGVELCWHLLRKR